jgi:peptidyl-prolyl cis-trans isomerase A (cyclophilin A)
MYFLVGGLVLLVMVILLVGATNRTGKAGSLRSKSTSYQCPYMKFTQLTELERNPRAGPTRHIIDPPVGGNQTLVCCETTQGPWNIFVHQKWAPIGARRFLDMVESGYFSMNKPENKTITENDESKTVYIKGGVPLMRCINNFLCQFGLAGNITHLFQSGLADDVQWLPPGPDGRKNAAGIKRFNKGYFSYAGSGPNSRSNQLFVALHDDSYLGGGSPWEVPFGELVGAHSYTTLDAIYTGYGEKGPPQGLLHREHAMEQVALKWPLLDAVLSCNVVDNVLDSVS